VFGRSGASAPPAVRKFSRHGHPGQPCAGTSDDFGDRVHLLKRLLIGRPFARARMARTLLPKRLALPLFASHATP
jgi:hypothetical protein